MTFEEWNEALARHFFNEEMAGKEVLLHSNDALLARLANSDAALSNFIAAIQSGPSGTRGSLCQRALQLHADWRSRGAAYPPYIAYLVLFVLAAGTDDDFAPNAYYPRLWKLLGEEPQTRMLPSFDRMITLFSDLETWSREDRHEELGRFIARIRGGMINIGLPLSQTILSEDERKKLPVVFSRAELDPNSLPAGDVLVRLAAEHGRDIFGRKTLRLLDWRATDDTALKHALRDFLVEELASWDGALETIESDARKTRVQAGLKLCLEMDLLARVVRLHLRFRSPRPYPVGGLTFDGGTDGVPWTCTESFGGWSTPLSLANESRSTPVDPATLDWLNGRTLHDSENEWRARLRGSDVRLLMRGDEYSIHGWVETSRLERGCGFTVLCTGSRIKEVSEWGRRECSKFSRHEVSGLPDGWALFSGEGVSRPLELRRS